MCNLSGLTNLILFSFLFGSISVSAQDPSTFKPLSGTLVVVNKLADSVSFIDIGSRNIIAHRATGKGPHELAMSADGKTAVVTDYVGGNSLSVFDVQGMTLIKRIDLSQYPRPHGIQFLANQTQVAVSSEGSDSVVIVDIKQGAVIRAITTGQAGSHMVAMPASTKTLYTSNMYDHSVSQIDIVSGQVIRQWAMHKIPEAIAVDQAGTQLWVGSNHSGFVSLYDIASHREIAQFSGFEFPYRIVLSQDEKLAVIPDYQADTLDVIDVQTRKRLNKIQFAADTGPKGVIFHPAGQRLFQSAYMLDKVLVVDVETGRVLYTLPTGDGPDGIGYSALALLSAQ